MTAMTSIYYNVSDFSELKKIIHEGNTERISRLWTRYVWAGGVKLQGLVKRRQAELNLFLTNKNE